VLDRLVVQVKTPRSFETLGTARAMTQRHIPGRTESSMKFVFVYAEILPSKFLECGLKTLQYASQCLFHVL
jgi:hypothetical protein